MLVCRMGVAWGDEGDRTGSNEYGRGESVTRPQSRGGTLLSYSIWAWLGPLVQTGRAYITIDRSTLGGRRGGHRGFKEVKRCVCGEGVYGNTRF